MLKDFALGLSLANLCYLRVWSLLLDPATLFYLKSSPHPLVYLAAMLGVLLLGALLGGMMTLARHLQHEIARTLWNATLLLLLAVIANSILQVAFSGGILRPNWEVPILLTGALVSLIALIAWPHLLNVGSTMALLMLAFVPITFGQGLRSYWTSGAAIPDSATAPFLESNHRPQRVVWLVFDEFDQRLAFVDRPGTVSLPELERLRSQAIYATSAYPPASDTIVSMPALISGQPVARATPIDSHKLFVRRDTSEEAVLWSQQPNIFGAARADGFNTALVGWFLPYCRLIAGTLTSCSWHLPVGDNRVLSLSGSIQDHARIIVATIPVAGPWIKRMTATRQQLQGAQQASSAAYRSVSRDASQLVADSRYGLILAHFPIPHPPGIYNRFRDDFSYNADSNYFDNLELTDRAVGDIREALEAAGLWENATILISGDHSMRTMWSKEAFWTEEEARFAAATDPRVPFLLKMRGQTEGLTYDTSFNTVLSHDLILGILRGDLAAPQDVVRWLDQHRSAPASVPLPNEQ